jgi:hypothetical protein
LFLLPAITVHSSLFPKLPENAMTANNLV